MLYELVRRDGRLVMPVSLFNFLLTNRIDYTYNFEQGGIELSETAYNRLISGFKPGFEEKAIKCTGTAQNPVKNENKRLNKQVRHRLW